ncbi:hypothetical protein Btru_028751 [Bulinus truncatus]|nr:hypothetical protein Btru_028751 [Bulinus truncatus]
MALYGPSDDSMMMFIQSAIKFIHKLNRNLEYSGVYRRMFNIIKGDTQRSLERKPFVKLSQRGKKFKEDSSPAAHPYPQGTVQSVGSVSGMCGVSLWQVLAQSLAAVGSVSSRCGLSFLAAVGSVSWQLWTQSLAAVGSVSGSRGLSL